MQDRAGDVVRQVGDDVVRRLHEPDQVLVERIALDQPQRLDALEPLAQEGRQAAIELDRGHLGAGRQQPAGEQAEPRADLEDPPARRRIRLGEDRVEDVGIGQEVLRQGVACAEPGRAERERGPSPGRRGPTAAAAHRAASGSDGRASRSSPARSPAANRRAPAAPIIAPLSVHSAGPRHDERQPERLGLAGQPGAQGAVGRHAAADHDRAGADRCGSPDRLRGEDVDDRVLEAPRELGDDVVGQRHVRGRGQPGIRPSLLDDPARGRLEPGEAEVVANRPAMPAGRRGRAASRPRRRDRSPVRPGSPGRAAGRPCRRPRRRRRRGSCRGVDRSGGRASRRGRYGRRTRRARRAGRPDLGGPPRPGSRSHAA